MSQALVGIYTAGIMVASLGSLAFLERWLKRGGGKRLLQMASLALIALFPAWLFLPGVATRFGLGMVMAFVFGLYWPVAQGQTLASVPGRGGTITAVMSLYGLIPLGLLFGLLAEAIGLTAAMFWVFIPALLVVLAVVSWMPERRGAPASEAP
jgi:hypothetical protein